MILKVELIIDFNFVPIFMNDVYFAVFVRRSRSNMATRQEFCIGQFSASGVSAANDAYVRVFYGVRYRDPVVKAKTAWFDVKIAPKWVDVLSDFFAAFLFVC